MAASLIVRFWRFHGTNYKGDGVPVTFFVIRALTTGKFKHCGGLSTDAKSASHQIKEFFRPSQNCTTQQTRRLYSRLRLREPRSAYTPIPSATPPTSKSWKTPCIQSQLEQTAAYAATCSSMVALPIALLAVRLRDSGPYRAPSLRRDSLRMLQHRTSH